MQDMKFAHLLSTYQARIDTSIELSSVLAWTEIFELDQKPIACVIEMSGLLRTLSSRPPRHWWSFATDRWPTCPTNASRSFRPADSGWFHYWRCQRNGYYSFSTTDFLSKVTTDRNAQIQNKLFIDFPILLAFKQTNRITNHLSVNGRVS